MQLKGIVLVAGCSLFAPSRPGQAAEAVCNLKNASGVQLTLTCGPGTSIKLTHPAGFANAAAKGSLTEGQTSLLATKADKLTKLTCVTKDEAKPSFSLSFKAGDSTESIRVVKVSNGWGTTADAKCMLKFTNNNGEFIIAKR